MKAVLPLISSLILLVPLGCGEDVSFPATGTVSGDLIYEDGEPVEGLEILMEEVGMSGVTNANGRFIIHGVPILDHSETEISYVVRGETIRDGVDVSFLVDRVRVEDQETYYAGRITLQPPGLLAGAVLVPGSSDNSGVQVLVDGTTLNGVTRRDGIFVILNVPANEGYRLLYRKDGFEEQIRDSLPGDEGPLPSP